MSDVLSADELALFGPSTTATPPPAVQIPDSVAVLPPDAAPNSTGQEAPKKRGRKPKAPVVVDVKEGESEEQATARQVLEQGKPYELPSGQVGTFTCVTNGEAASFKTAAGVELVPPGVEVKPAEKVFPLQLKVDSSELTSSLALIARALRAAADALEGK